MMCIESGTICDFRFCLALGTCSLRIKGLSILPVCAKFDPWFPLLLSPNLLLLCFLEFNPHSVERLPKTISNSCSLFQLSDPHLYSPTKCFHATPHRCLEPSIPKEEHIASPAASFVGSLFSSSTPCSGIKHCQLSAPETLIGKTYHGHEL